MNNDVFVDIVVPCYNVENVIEKCVVSLINLNYDYNKLKIFFVNDGSTDSTGKILQKYSQYFQINIINHNKNKGLSAARNSGIKAGSGEIICFLDSDMVIESEWLNIFLETSSKNNIVGVVGDIQLPKKYKANHLDKYLYDERRGARKFGENKRIKFQYFLFNNSCVKRKAIEKIGLFNENIISYGGEDTEFAIRLWNKYPNGLRFSSKALSYHYHQRELKDFLKSMRDYGSINLPSLVKIHPNYSKELAWDYINSFKGYLLFNFIIRYVIKNLNCVFDNYWFKRYLVIDSVISGARSNNK